MKILDWFFGRKATQLTYDQVAGLIDGWQGGSVAGVAVNDKTALQVSTVFACVKAIADGCATPKLHVYRGTAGATRQLALNVPEYRLLARRPNEWQTSFEWRRQMTIHAALTGTGLSIKSKGLNGRVRELIPVMPGQWDVRRTARYELRYRCWDEFGLIGEFDPDDVFLLNNVQWDWVKSLNAVVLARSAIGLALATERSQASMHANGLRPSGLYSVDGTLTPEQHERLTTFLKRSSGPDKTGIPLILDRAAKWLSTGLTGVDAQHVETRRLQVEEICRAYGVFPIMVGHSDKSATFASSEAFFAAHVKHTLAPWHEAWTQRIDETLLDGAGPLFAGFDTRYLMAGSMKDRAAWARTMAEMGVYTRNELRDEEGKDPLPGLDEPLTPLNMTQGQQDDTAEEEAKAHKAWLQAELKALKATVEQSRAVPVPAQHNFHLDVKTAHIESAVSNALQTISDQAAAHIREAVQTPPITVNVPQQPAPVVNVAAPVVHVAAPQVTFEANLPPATVTVTGPTESVQTVERDDAAEITRTVTRHTYGNP